jgi:hypothetical protein
MVKYVTEKVGTGDKRALALAKRYRFELIDIPEEFKNISIDDMKVKKDKRNKRQIIRHRTNKDLSKYDAWRIHDRFIYKGGGK